MTTQIDLKISDNNNLFVPLKFWFNQNTGLAFPPKDYKYDSNEEIHKFCNCCGDEVISLMNDIISLTEKEIEDKINFDANCLYTNGLVGITLDYINNYISANKYINNYEAAVNEIVTLCIEFLIADKLNLFTNKSKYIALYSFITEYLKIPDTGYPYIIMQWLENKDIIEHGSGIRCGWLSWKSREDLTYGLCKTEKICINVTTDLFNIDLIPLIYENEKIIDHKIISSSIIIDNTSDADCLVTFIDSNKQNHTALQGGKQKCTYSYDIFRYEFFSINNQCQIKISLCLINVNKCKYLNDIVVVMNK